MVRNSFKNQIMEHTENQHEELEENTHGGGEQPDMNADGRTPAYTKEERRGRYDCWLATRAGRLLMIPIPNPGLYPDNQPRLNCVSWGIGDNGVFAGGTPCTTFLDAHPMAEAVSIYAFRVPPGASMFAGALGMALEPSHPGAEGNFTGMIRLHADDGMTNEVWSANWHGASASQPQIEFGLPLLLNDGRCAEFIELLVNADGDNNSDQAVWVDPRFIVEY